MTDYNNPYTVTLDSAGLTSSQYHDELFIFINRDGQR
jgi:hypothetical protein